MKRLIRTINTSTVENGGNYTDCQASFNSDGCLTLRNYDRCDKANDEIIILTDDETQAIVRLFRKMKPLSDCLPF